MGGLERYRHQIGHGRRRRPGAQARAIRRGFNRTRRPSQREAHRALAALLTLLALLLFAPALARLGVGQAPERSSGMVASTAPSTKGSPRVVANTARPTSRSIRGVASTARPTTPRGAPVRAAYFYDYMPPSHLDTLVALGFGRAVIHTIADTVGARERPQWMRLLARGKALGIEVVPEWLAQSRSRMRGERRYIGSEGALDPAIPCPLDSLQWRLALLDRTQELVSLEPSPKRVAVDLEMSGASRTHWNAGACRCRACLEEFAAASLAASPGDRSELLSHRPPGDRELLAFEERRIEHILTGVLGEFARRFPGVELGVLDLDRSLFPHRALGRALARTGVPTADYSECSYATAGEPLAAARMRLDQLGLSRAPLYGGLWLQRFTPGQMRAAIASIQRHADGVFVFTTYSLWQQPDRLTGPYTLGVPAARYAHALSEALRR